MNYGITYMGSKSGIAEKIIDLLPARNRFVDLFGGGAAMSHCAYMSGKYKQVLYRDFNQLICDVIKAAIAGDYDLNKFRPRFVGKAEFDEKKEKDGYTKYFWSFGVGGMSYLYGQEHIEFKQALHAAVFDGDTEQAARFYPDIDQISGQTPAKRWRSISRIAAGEEFRLVHAERLNRANGLSGLPIAVECAGYQDYQHQTGDVVYCDPPYYGAAGYGQAFDFQAFYDWVASRDFDVYFSSYDIPDKRFNEVWSTCKNCTFSSNSNSLRRIEKLYCNREKKLLLL